MLSTKAKLGRLGMSINSDCPFCLKPEEAIDYILKTHNLAISIWCIINPLFTNLGIIDWLEYLWLNKS